MKIAINGLSARFGGGVTYLRNLLGMLSRIDHENEYVIFTCPENAGRFASVDKADNFSIVSPGFPGKALIRRFIWEQTALPAFIKRRGIDILFSPGGIAPVIVPGRCKRINMIQNMAPFSDELMASYPLSKRKMRFLILRKLYPLFAASADANVFISTHGLNTIHRMAKLHEGKSAVIYHGRNELFGPVYQEDAAGFVQEHYGVSGGFVLYVSSIARYKKQSEVVQAYHIIREKGAKVNRLVLAGTMVERSYHDEVFALADRLGIRNEVIYPGKIPRSHLPYLYSAASVFVFASICENCPNILIEAMACGAPIVASERDPMPEICRNAALYFDPTRPLDMADRMWRVLSSEEIRQELSRNALENVKRFSWEETARRTMEVFRSTGHAFSSEV